MAAWKLWFLVGLTAIIAAPIVASRFLPWWGTMLVLLVEVALIIALGPQMIRWAITRIVVSLLQKKSRVLRGADLRIEQVSLTVRPDDAGEEDDCRYVQIRGTLIPQPHASEMQFYEPGELLLVPYDATVSLDEHQDDAQSASAVRVRLIEETNLPGREAEKITGPAALEILFAVPQTLSGRVKFRYYFEQFGDVMLP